jgi:hypothetical protein
VFSLGCRFDGKRFPAPSYRLLAVLVNPGFERGRAWLPAEGKFKRPPLPTALNNLNPPWKKLEIGGISAKITFSLEK